MAKIETLTQQRDADRLHKKGMWALEKLGKTIDPLMKTVGIDYGDNFRVIFIEYYDEDQRVLVAVADTKQRLNEKPTFWEKIGIKPRKPQGLVTTERKIITTVYRQDGEVALPPIRIPNIDLMTFRNCDHLKVFDPEYLEGLNRIITEGRPVSPTRGIRKI